MKFCQFWSKFFLPAVVLVACGSVVSSTRVKGSLSYDSRSQGKRQFVFFLNRFGVSKGHHLFVHGRVWYSNDYIAFNSVLTLALVPQDTWDSFYRVAPRSRFYNDDMCSRIITNTALNESIQLGDDRCLINGTSRMDYLRSLPCDHSGENFKPCNQPPSIGVLNGSDFTFNVVSAPKTEYYYLFFMTCTRNFSASVDCEWGLTEEIEVNYDIRLVNNLPGKANAYTNEFPYDLQGMLSLQLVFSIFYLSLILAHFILHSHLCVDKRYRMHVLVKIFSISLVLESVFILLELLHSAVYAGNGSGVVVLRYFGEVANQGSDWLLILVVILVGKGWQVTTSSLRWSKVTVAIWGAYIFFSAVYFVWMVVSEQVYPLSLSLYHSYQSWAGAFYLAYRLFILLYLLYEMRQVYLIEIRPTALWLYRILAVCYIVWFCYLPLITVFFLLLNPVHRLLAMSTSYFVFDFLINFGMVVLFCPRWANKCFQFNNYINILSQPPSGYRSLKSYGSGPSSRPTTPAPI